jgi:hypothetical protein
MRWCAEEERPHLAAASSADGTLLTACYAPFPRQHPPWPSSLKTGLSTMLGSWHKLTHVLRDELSEMDPVGFGSLPPL